MSLSLCVDSQAAEEMMGVHPLARDGLQQQKHLGPQLLLRSGLVRTRLVFLFGSRSDVEPAISHSHGYLPTVSPS